MNDDAMIGCCATWNEEIPTTSICISIGGGIFTPVLVWVREGTLHKFNFIVCSLSIAFVVQVRRFYIDEPPTR